MKVIMSLENRVILFKETTTKSACQKGGFLNFPRPLMTAALPLMKSVGTPVGKSVLVPLELSAGMSAANADIHKNIYGSGATALIVSNEEMGNIMKILKSFEKLALIIKTISETIKMNQNTKQTDFFQCC